MNNEYIYGVQILDDIHNYFPDLLYNNRRFDNVQDVFAYIRINMPNYHIYNANCERYRNFINNARVRYSMYPSIPPQWTVSRRGMYSRFGSAAVRSMRRSRTEERGEELDDQQENIANILHRTYTTPVVTTTSISTPPRTPIATMPPTNSSIPISRPIPREEDPLLYESLNYPTPLLRTSRLSDISIRSGTILQNNVLDTMSNGIGNAVLSTITQLFPTIANIDIQTEDMEPAIVHPTREEIRNSTTEEILTTNDMPLCTICQENMPSGSRVRRLCYCDHFFHKECIDTWFERNVRCPICRDDIREVHEEDDNMDTSP